MYYEVVSWKPLVFRQNGNQRDPANVNVTIIHISNSYILLGNNLLSHNNQIHQQQAR